MDEIDFSFPALPYAGTSGWSGSDASQDRQKWMDYSGTTSLSQLKVYDLARKSGREGIIWKEVAEALDIHHGSASNVLSVLDKVGVLVRLKERRNNCSIYVTPSWVIKREIAVRKKKSCKHCGGDL